MKENLERIKQVIAEGSDAEKLELAEQLLNDNSPVQAQNVLDSVNERDGKWHFLQSKVFYVKGWIYESKKQMEIALQSQPDNAQYIEEMERLNALGEAAPHSENQEKQGKQDMGKRNCKDDCAEACCMGCGECICTVICESICGGCS